VNRFTYFYPGYPDHASPEVQEESGLIRLAPHRYDNEKLKSLKTKYSGRKLLNNVPKENKQ